MMRSESRYVITLHGVPLFTTHWLRHVVAWLWGRDTQVGYIVWEDQTPHFVHDANLTAWSQHFQRTSPTERMPHDFS